MISTTAFCRDRFLTDRYRILITRSGFRNIGAATVRVRSPESGKRCRPTSDIED